jgi:hypothetical protein
MTERKNGKISTFEIQMNNHNGERKEIMSGNRVVRSEECCLTCGGNKRLQWIEKVDGKKTIKEACLFCLTTPDAPKPTTENLDNYVLQLRTNYRDAYHTQKNRVNH